MFRVAPPAEAGADWEVSTVLEASVSDMTLVDFDGEAAKEESIREAIANPTCGWFYRRSTDAFKSIPGTPIAYWVPERMIDAYKRGRTFGSEAHPKVGMQTSKNDKFLRLWWEIGGYQFGKHDDGLIWIKYLKGGDYRKWYGNLWSLLHYNGNPEYILQQPNARVQDVGYLERCKCTWTDLTSGEPSFRLAPTDSFYDISGHCFLPAKSDQLFLLAYANTSIVALMKRVFNSSFHFQVGDLSKIAIPTIGASERSFVEKLSRDSVGISRADWDSVETSWDFRRHPMVGD